MLEWTFLALLATTGSYEQIQARCADMFPTSFQMQEACETQQGEAVLRLNPIISGIKPNSPEHVALFHCRELFTDEHGYNWTMLEACYRQEMAAHARLRGK